MRTRPMPFSATFDLQHSISSWLKNKSDFSCWRMCSLAHHCRFGRKTRFVSSRRWIIRSPSSPARFSYLTLAKIRNSRRANLLGLWLKVFRLRVLSKGQCNMILLIKPWNLILPIFLNTFIICKYVEEL